MHRLVPPLEIGRSGADGRGVNGHVAVRDRGVGGEGGAAERPGPQGRQPLGLGAQVTAFKSAIRTTYPSPASRSRSCPGCQTRFEPDSFTLLPDADRPREIRVVCAPDPFELRVHAYSGADIVEITVELNPDPVIEFDAPPAAAAALVYRRAEARGGVLASAVRLVLPAFRGGWIP